MTFKNCATSALIAVAVLGATACKDEDSNGSGAGGARGVESAIDAEIDDLKDQIKALQDLLDDEAGDVDTIEGALEAAQSRLDDLIVCGNGGDCELRAEAIEALTPITDAYCDYLFGCCSEEEVAGALGYSFGDVDACKSVYTDFITRGHNQSFYHSGSQSADYVTNVIEGLLSNAATFAVQLEQGVLSLDLDNIDACAESVGDLSCADDQNSCLAPSVGAACEQLFQGQQGEGEPCRASQECDDDLVCDYELSEGTLTGIITGGSCIAQAVVDDVCRDDDDCATDDDSLFCKDGVKTCQEKVEAGGDCVFLDSSLVSRVLDAPCVAGYECSVKTNTCIAACEKDSICTNGGNSCKDGFTCNITDDRDEFNDLNGGYGFCDVPKVGGDEVVDGRECASGELVYSGSEDVCAGLEGDDCQIDDDCFNEGCVDFKCVASCDVSEECDSGEYCEGNRNAGACIPLGEVGDSCETDEGCEDSYCQGSVCTAFVATGDDCSSYRTRSCEPEDFCERGSFISEGSGYEYDCVVDGEEGDECNTGEGGDDCEGDLVCAYDGSDYICQTETGRSSGSYCSTYDQCSSMRCSGNVCVTPALEEGDTCSVDDPTVSGLQATYDIKEDPCEQGLYCRRDNRSPADLTGVCTKQGKQSSNCDAFVSSYSSLQAQCEGNLPCSYQDDLGYEICPVTDDTNSNICPLDRVQYESTSVSMIAR